MRRTMHLLVAASLGSLLATAVPGCGSSNKASTTSVGGGSSSGGQSNGGQTSDGQGGSTSTTTGGTDSGTGTEFAFHVVDVGSGLGIFVEGPGFTLVYDAGSDDDSTMGGHSNRFMDYLSTVRPGLKYIDHVILSHPHHDHVDLLPDVLAGYDIGDIWDSGVTSTLCAYQAFIIGVESKLNDKDASTVPTYHTAANEAGLHDLALDPCHNDGSVLTPNPNPDGRPSVSLPHGSRITSGLAVDLGTRAKMTFLYVNGVTAKNPNFNSLVVRIDIDGKRFLLPGDANDEVDSIAPTGTLSVEEQLLQLPAGELTADVLVAGYHGYSGAATGFIAAVAPAISIISSAPAFVRPYDTVIAALEQNNGQVFRTDTEDNACKTDSSKIGSTNDGRIGGCSNVKVTIDNGSIVAQYLKSKS